MKKLIVFDLDGTLAESKVSIDEEIALLLSQLLDVTKVAIISGADWPQFEKQVLAQLPATAALKELSILPACGTKYYQFDTDWSELYAENFTEPEKKKIIDQLNKVSKAANLKIVRTWGNQLEDRGSQVTFSALGQRAPVEVKKKWDPDFIKRKKMKTQLDKSLAEFSVTLGGSTSIDVTKPGIDKAYGIHKLEQQLDLHADEIGFIGDALFEGGNDHPVRATGVACIQVRDAEETKKVIETILAFQEPVQTTKPV